jgi:chaperonin GroES
MLFDRHAVTGKKTAPAKKPGFTPLTDEPHLTICAWSLALLDQECQVQGSTLEKRGYQMAFRPLHDRVLVRRVEAEEKTAGGIIIPDSAKEKPQEGEVLAVGAGARDETGKLVPLDVKDGDRILFGKWSGTEVKIDGEDLIIMKESDILGILEGAKTVRKAA